MASFDDEFGELRSACQSAPSVHAFSQIQRTLGALFMIDPFAARARALPYAASHVERWPDEACVLEFSESTLPGLLPRDPAQLGLVKRLKLGSHAGVFDRRGTQATDALVEAIEGGLVGRIALDRLSWVGEQGQRVVRAILGSRELERIDTLELGWPAEMEDFDGFAHAVAARADVVGGVETWSGSVGRALVPHVKGLSARRSFLEELDGCVESVRKLSLYGIYDMELRDALTMIRQRARSLQYLEVGPGAGLLGTLRILGEERVRQLVSFSHNEFGWGRVDQDEPIGLADSLQWLEGLERLRLHGTPDQLEYRHPDFRLPSGLKDLGFNLLGTGADGVVEDVLSAFEPIRLKSLSVPSLEGFDERRDLLPNLTSLSLNQVPAGFRLGRWSSSLSSIEELSVSASATPGRGRREDGPSFWADVLDTDLPERLGRFGVTNRVASDRELHEFVERSERGRLHRLELFEDDLNEARTDLVRTSLIPYVRIEESLPF